MNDNQRNPNNDAYWQARGYDKRPDDWQEQVKQQKTKAKGNKRKDRAGGDLAFDGFGLLPQDGFGRLSVDDY